MISKNQLKELCRYRQQKQCDEEQVFVVEGVKMCDEVLAAHWPVLAIAATADWLDTHRSATAEVVHEVSEADLQRLSGMVTPNQVWMLLRRPPRQEWDGDSKGGLVLALDRIQNPGNLGTLLRTADWYGVRNILCSPDTVNCYNPKVVQASMGSLLRTRLFYAPLAPMLQEHGRAGHPVLGAMLNGEDIRQMPPFRQATPLLLIGNESRGLSPELSATVTHRVTIPNRGGTAESLNASVAAAILMDNLLR